LKTASDMSQNSGDLKVVLSQYLTNFFKQLDKVKDHLKKAKHSRKATDHLKGLIRERIE